MGSIIAGCICAGIYATNNPEACKYITEHGKANVVVLEGNKQLEKYASAISEGRKDTTTETLPHLTTIVVWGDEAIDAQLIEKCSPKNVYTWAGIWIYS